MSRMKKTVIVDVVFVNKAMWAEGWERGKMGEAYRVGQLLPDWEPGWMGIRHHEQENGPPSKGGILYYFCKGFDKLCVHCEDIN